MKHNKSIINFQTAYIVEIKKYMIQINSFKLKKLKSSKIPPDFLHLATLVTEGK